MILILLFSGISIGGGVGFYNVNKMDWSDATVAKNCQKEVDLGEYVDLSRCVEETIKSGVGIGAILMFSSAVSGILALAIGLSWLFIVRRSANFNDGKRTS